VGLILEVCVDTVAGLDAAVAVGADRIELCSALALGGLTPSAGFMAEAAACDLPVMAMIRPRAGDFVWSEAEVAVMEADIAAAGEAGLAGVVLGASLPDGRLDVPVLERLVAAASAGVDLTLHRCFDLVPDMGVALEQAVGLGFRRILTSGGAKSAEAGAARIAELIGQAAGRIVIMPGAGVGAGNAARLLGLGTRELHGSCSVTVHADGPEVALGFGPATVRKTDEAMVRAVKRAMEDAVGDQRHV
jgi:copper homeostasis protein